MTIGGYAGMVAAAPLGALVDATHAKRAIMIGSALTISAASMAILFMPSFPATAASQIATRIAGAAVVPVIAGVALLLWIGLTPLMAEACDINTKLMKRTRA